MLFLYFSIFLTVLSNIFYHIFQKSIAASINPIISLIITYISAIIISLLILPFYPDKTGLIDSIKGLNWSSFALGGAIVGLEMGFLLAYRAGWNIGLAAVFSNVAVAVFLIPIGLLIYKENLTLMNLLGIMFCITGLVLIRQA